MALGLNPALLCEALLGQRVRSNSSTTVTPNRVRTSVRRPSATRDQLAMRPPGRARPLTRPARDSLSPCSVSAIAAHDAARHSTWPVRSIQRILLLGMSIEGLRQWLAARGLITDLIYRMCPAAVLAGDEHETGSRTKGNRTVCDSRYKGPSSSSFSPPGPPPPLGQSG